MDTTNPDTSRGGMRVGYVDVTIPGNADVYVPGGRKPALLAYCWIKIHDGPGDGHEFGIADVRLMRNDNGYFLNYPTEVCEVRCAACSGRNKPRARFCNWCAVALTPSSDKQHRDHVFPCNPKTTDMVLTAVVAAYNEQLDRRERATPARRPSQIFETAEKFLLTRLRQVLG